MTNTYRGSCHCGAIRLLFTSALSASELVPRSDEKVSDFHWNNNGVWISDPQGRLEVIKSEEERHYQTGPAVDFCFCGICGTLCYAAVEYDHQLFGVVRAKTLEETGIDWGKTLENDFRDETADEAKVRRMADWTPLFFQ